MTEPIRFNYEGKDYELKFTRTSIVSMENKKIKFLDFEEKPLTATLNLFYGSFLANHPAISKDKTDEIYDNLTRKDKLIERLFNMYQEQILDTTDDTKNKIEWN